jgi:hypothetical protein
MEKSSVLSSPNIVFMLRVVDLNTKMSERLAVVQ